MVSSIVSIRLSAMKHQVKDLIVLVPSHPSIHKHVRLQGNFTVVTRRLLHTNNSASANRRSRAVFIYSRSPTQTQCATKWTYPACCKALRLVDDGGLPKFSSGAGQARRNWQGSCIDCRRSCVPPRPHIEAYRDVVRLAPALLLKKSSSHVSKAKQVS